MTKSENFSCFPCEDLLSRCFHFGVFEIFVPNLFLLPFSPFQYICVSATYKQAADYQEEDHDSH